MLENITSEQFSSLIDKSLELAAGGQRYRMQVAEVRAFPPHGERPVAPFSVVLRGARELRLAQGIYRLQHPSLGALDLFVVPIGPDAHGMRYEIVFN